MAAFPQNLQQQGIGGGLAERIAESDAFELFPAALPDGLLQITAGRAVARLIPLSEQHCGKFRQHFDDSRPHSLTGETCRSARFRQTVRLLFEQSVEKSECGGCVISLQSTAGDVQTANPVPVAKHGFDGGDFIEGKFFGNR